MERTLLATLSLTTIGGFTQGKNLFSAMFAEQGEPMPPFVIFLQKRVLDFTTSNSAVAEIFPAVQFQNSLFRSTVINYTYMMPALKLTLKQCYHAKTAEENLSKT